MHMMHVRVQDMHNMDDACLPFGAHTLHVMYGNLVIHLSFHMRIWFNGKPIVSYLGGARFKPC